MIHFKIETTPLEWPDPGRHLFIQVGRFVLILFL